MSKISTEMFRRLTWYRRYEAFRGNRLGVFRDVREMLLVMEAAVTFRRLPREIYQAVIDAELDCLERMYRGQDLDESLFPEGFHVMDDHGNLLGRRARERSSYPVRAEIVDGELSHRATDYRLYMKRTGDDSVLRDDRELIRVIEAAGTMKRLPAVVRNSFYQAELLWDPSSFDGRPKALEGDTYSAYVNPYVTDAEREH